MLDILVFIVKSKFIIKYITYMYGIIIVTLVNIMLYFI